MSGTAERLAQYVVSLKYDDLPWQAADMAGKCVFDSIGNMCCGRYSPMGKRILNYVREYSGFTAGEPEVSLLGGGKNSRKNVLAVHTVIARCADLDDGHRYAMGHPGSVIIPAVLSAGELKKRTGKEMLAAAAAGYDVYCRIGAAVNPTSYRERGFDATGIVGAVACAAAVGKLYGLNTEQMKNALGIAGLFSGGLIEYQNDGSMGKVLCGCFAAENGFQAVQMAKCGFTGPEKVFEGPKGFFQAFSNEPDPSHVLEDLGKTFRITEVYFKKHACMRGLHAAMDAALKLRSQGALRGSDIEEVEVRTTPFVGRLSNPRPETLIGAQCSLEFVLAAALEKGHISREEVLSEALHQQEIFRLASRIHLKIDETVEKYVQQNPSHWAAVNMIIRTKDGRVLKEWVPLPAGEAENPLEWAELEEKFRRMISGTPFEAGGEELISRIRKFETLTGPEELGMLWKTEKESGAEYGRN